MILETYRSDVYNYYTGPAMNLTSLEMVDGESDFDCTRACTIVNTCTAVKVTTAGKRRKICQLYKEPNGTTTSQETNLYVKI